MPTPVRLQETGTVILILSTTESLLAAEVEDEDKIRPETRVRLSKVMHMYEEVLSLVLLTIISLL
jgi:hypothetical protein